jgi:hypothetical protein
VSGILCSQWPLPGGLIEKRRTVRDERGWTPMWRTLLSKLPSEPARTAEMGLNGPDSGLLRSTLSALYRCEFNLAALKLSTPGTPVKLDIASEQAALLSLHLTRRGRDGSWGGGPLCAASRYCAPGARPTRSWRRCDLHYRQDG